MSGARYRAASRCVVRTPLLPIEVLERWGGSTPRPESELRKELRAILEDAAVREAIWLASPNLATHLAPWLANPEAADVRDLEHAVVRYVSRMAGRATPFGIMSGIGVGAIGPRSRLEIAGRDSARRDLRIDNDYLSKTCAALAARPEIQARLRYLPNSSLYEVAGKLRYAETRFGRGRTYHLVAVEPTEYLMTLLERARRGLTIAELVEVLLEDPDIGTEDAEGFVAQLIETQLLVPDLELPITGPPPLGVIVDALRALAPPEAAALAAAGDQLAALAAVPLGVEPARYEAIAEALERTGPVRVERKLFVQVDLYKPAPDFVVGKRIVDDVTRGLDLLIRIGGGGVEDIWTRFRAAFGERYSTREVALVEVLDEEIGIGFRKTKPTSALDIELPTRPEAGLVRWGRRERYLMRLIERARQAGSLEVELTPGDEAALAAPSRPHDLLAVPIVIGAESAEAVERGQYVVRLVGGDAPGPRMLGRFCHGSPEIEALTREQLVIEEAAHPDAIHAELVHLPEGRLGNLILRPILRGHEIAYLGRSGIDREHQIPVTDLMVSVVGNRVVLRSRALGREVLPRMTNAHNFRQGSLQTYEFLAAFAQQEGIGVGWSWSVLQDAPFTPRVRVGRVVLARARWTLTEAELSMLRGPDVPRVVAELRRRMQFPRWIVVADADSELPVDLDNSVSVASFAALVRSEEQVVIHELFPSPDQMVVRGPEGRFAHEIQLMYAREHVHHHGHARPAADPVPRRFPPNTSWLFFKLYAGYTTCDDVIRALAPLARELIEAHEVERWFWIRYGDPEWHVRVRFAGDPMRLAAVQGRVSAALRPLIDTGAIWKVQLDTYDREVERYGGAEAIELAEQIFAADSEAVAAMLEAYSGDLGADMLWRLTLRGVDRMLDDLGLDLTAKRKVVTDMRDMIGSEVGMDTAFQKRLGEKYRTHREAIEQVLAPAIDDDQFAAGIAALDRRTVALRPIGDRLRILGREHRLTSPFLAIAGSHVHMHVNRMLAASPRLQELVVNDMLKRHYDAIAGRAKQRAKETP